MLTVLSVAAAALFGPTLTPPAPAEVTASWPQFHGQADHVGYNPIESVLETQSVTGLGIAWTAQTGGAITSSPTVANGMVYLSSYDTKVYAFNATTGAVVWTYKTGGEIRASSVAESNGVVYVGSDDKNVYALDAITGAKVWSFATNDFVRVTPTIQNGIVYVGSQDGHVYALNATTGAVVWDMNTVGSVEISAAVENGVVFVGSVNYVTMLGTMWALDASTGAVIWSKTFDSFLRSAPTTDNGIVYFGSDGGTIYALNETTGATVWTAKPTGIGTFYAKATPAVANGLLYETLAEYTPDSNGYEYAFDASTGAVVWSAAMIDYATSSPAVAGGVVYAASFDWRLYAFDAATGTVLWKYVNDKGMNSSPAVVNGYVYIADLFGKVMAFKDVTGPTMSFDAAPSSPTNQKNATFQFHANEPTQAGWTCQIDSRPTVSCLPGKAYHTGVLADGTHTLAITATDVSGNAATTTFSWTVDTVPPVLTITGGPPPSTNKTTATFYLSSNESGSTYACTLDGAPLTCKPTTSLTGLADGTHTLIATTTDPAGNTSASVTRTWTVDTAAPTMTLTGEPPLVTSNTTATFTFVSDDSTAKLWCKKDSLGWNLCTSPFTWSKLSIGVHTFQVYAKDAAGNVSKTITYTWTVT